MSRSIIPDQLCSEGTIKYVGFEETKAAQLWEIFSRLSDRTQRETFSWLRPSKIELVDFLTNSVCQRNDVCVDDDAAWSRCMERWGIANEMQNAILDQRFKKLRLTRACEQWIRDTIRLRYKGLRDFLNTRGHKILRGGTSRPGSSIVEIDQNSQHNIPDTHRNRPSSFSGETLTFDDNFAAPGITVLYKAISARQAYGNSLLDREGNLKDVLCLEESPWIDFSGYKAMSYFTTSLQTAQMYASYMKRRDSGCGEVVVVRLCIPDVAFHNLKGVHLIEAYFPSDNWKRLIWYCRNTGPVEEVCRFDKATVVIGNVSSKPEVLLKEFESWEDVTNDHVLHTNGNGNADVQFAFSGDSHGREFFKTHVTDFKILSYSNTEYLEWIDKEK